MIVKTEQEEKCELWMNFILKWSLTAWSVACGGVYQKEKALGGVCVCVFKSQISGCDVTQEYKQSHFWSIFIQETVSNCVYFSPLIKNPYNPVFII